MRRKLPKLLAIDLDGTLFRRDGSIHPEDIAAVARVRAAGIHVTIATGRLYSGSRLAIRACEIEGAVACVDGSHIVDSRDDKNLFYKTITGAHAKLLSSVLEHHGTACFVFAQDGIVHDSEGHPYAHYVRTWSDRVDVVDHVYSHPHWEHEEGITAVVAVGAPEGIEAAAAQLKLDLAGVAHVVSFPVTRIENTHALVVRADGATKGTAIEWLAAHHGLTTEQIVVVGDWINDVPMFKAAGRSFVMGQAPPAVKACATDELEASAATGGGVAEAIKKVWG